MSKPKKTREDMRGFRELAWEKFNAFSLEEKVEMLKADGIPADEHTVNYYFSQLVEIAIERDLELLGAGWPWGPESGLLKKN